jgi:hypothetical protein
MNTHRAYLGTDTTVTCWVRNDSGKRDLSGFDSLGVQFYPYGSATDIGLDLVGTVAATGKATFEVTAANAQAYFTQGIVRFVLKGVDGTDSETLYSGLLEFV